MQAGGPAGSLDPRSGRRRRISLLIPGRRHPISIQYLLIGKISGQDAGFIADSPRVAVDRDATCRHPGSITYSMKAAMFRWFAHVVVLAMAVGLMSTAAMVAALSAPAAQEPERRDPFQRQVRPLLERYCADCHMNGEAEAGIDLDRFADQEAAVQGGRTWLRVRDALQGRIMPPADEDQPSPEESDRIVGWIENDFLAAQCARQEGSAPVVIRRLNRQEYNNTIRDLTGLDLHLADGFPPDEIGFGYDNVGSALNISPVHVEKYLDAAESALRKAIVVPDAGPYPPGRADPGLKTYSAARQPAGRVQARPEARSIPRRFQPGPHRDRGIGPTAAAGDRIRQGPPQRGGGASAGRDRRLSLLADGRQGRQHGPCRAGAGAGRRQSGQAGRRRRQRERGQAIRQRARAARRLDGRTRTRPREARSAPRVAPSDRFPRPGIR